MLPLDGIMLLILYLGATVTTAVLLTRPSLTRRCLGSLSASSDTLQDRFTVAAMHGPPPDVASLGTLSTSLFGRPTTQWHKSYWEPLLLSAESVSSVLPGWQLRVYLDPELSSRCVEPLVARGAQVYVMQHSSVGLSGTMWRFLAAAEPAPFVSIDADWPLDTEWATMIERWLEGTHPFFLRKHALSLVLPVTAGRWGARGALLCDIRERMTRYDDERHGADEAFLTRDVWPLMQHAGYEAFSDVWHKASVAGMCAGLAAVVLFVTARITVAL